MRVFLRWDVLCCRRRCSAALWEGQALPHRGLWPCTVVLSLVFGRGRPERWEEQLARQRQQPRLATGVRLVATRRDALGRAALAGQCFGCAHRSLLVTPRPFAPILLLVAHASRGPVSTAARLSFAAREPHAKSIVANRRALARCGGAVSTVVQSSAGAAAHP